MDIEQTSQQPENSQQPAQPTQSQPVSIADAMRSQLAEMKAGKARSEEKKPEKKQEPKRETKPENQEVDSGAKAKESNAEIKSEKKTSQEKTGELKKETESESKNSADESTKKEDSSTSSADNGDKKPARTAPSAWTPKAKLDFDSLPEHIQDEIIKREGDFLKGVAEFKSHSEEGRKLQKVLEPYAPLMRQKGLQSDQVVNDMLQTAYRLSQGTPQDKAGFLLEIAQQYGADLQSLITSGNNNGEQFQKIEYVGQLENQVSQLQKQIQQISGFLNKQVTDQQQSVYMSAEQSVESFRSEMENGKPKYPFFDNVRNDMAVLVKANPELDLKSAYDRAVWMNPQTREALLLQQQREASQKAEDERRRHAEEAKKKASLNVQSTQASEFSSQPLSDIRATMAARLRELNAAK